jgi:drug/metabolite transporter (DMT)-like permease
MYVMNGKAKGPLLIVCTAILWSFGGLLIKLVPWDAMTIVGVRSVFAALVMLVYMRRPHITFSWPVILGGLSMSGTTVLFVFANKLTTAANAIVLQYTAPIFVVLISIIFFRKRARALDLASVIMVFIGMALFFFDHLRADAMLGNILACLSGVTFAGVFLMNKAPGAKPEESVLLGHLINAVIGLPFAVMNVTFDLTAWGAISLLGIFQLGLAYVLFSIGIKHTPPISASLIASLEPLLNPLWVLLLTGEAPGVWALVGGAIVIVTIVIYNVADSKQNGRQDARSELQEHV